MPKAEKDLLGQPPEKVTEMYRAVIDLINEGVDINNMKVAEITARAGIGKGTAYEYFSTKEEIITNALFYEMMGHMQVIQEIAYNEQPFEQKIKTLMDYGVKHYHKGRTFFQLLKVGLGSYDISDSLTQEFKTATEENICRQFTVFLNMIIEAGRKENIIKETNKCRIRMVLYSQIVAFISVLFMQDSGEEAEISLEEIKQFIYDSVVKLLG